VCNDKTGQATHTREETRAQTGRIARLTPLWTSKGSPLGGVASIQTMDDLMTSVIDFSASFDSLI